MESKIALKALTFGFLLFEITVDEEFGLGKSFFSPLAGEIFAGIE